MADIFGKINAALSGQRADDGGHKDGFTTSGMDAAMQAHANQQHPVNQVGKSDQDFVRPKNNPKPTMNNDW